MKRTDTENRNKIVTAAVWSAAILLLLAVGMTVFLTAASRRTGTRTEATETKQKAPQQTEAVTENGNRKPQKAEPDVEKKTETTAEAAGAAADETVPDDASEPSWEEQTQPEAVDMTVTVTAYPGGDNFTCIMPVNGSVTKEFTEDIAVYSLTMNDYRVHNGIDIYAPVGTKVMACAAGTVERVWDDPFLGCCVEISHGGGLKSVYCNLSPDTPKGMEAGATVLAGDVIGGVGETMTVEMADTDHLHFCMTENGVYVDPLSRIGNYQSGSVPMDE